LVTNRTSTARNLAVGDQTTSPAPLIGPQLAVVDQVPVLTLTFGHKLHENDPETCS